MKKTVIAMSIVLIAIISILLIVFLNSTYIEVGSNFPVPYGFAGQEQQVTNNSYIITNLKIVKENKDGKESTLGRMKKGNLEELEQMIKKEIESKDNIDINSYSMENYVKLKGKTYPISKQLRTKLQDFIEEKLI